jgi:hypothetical protein
LIRAEAKADHGAVHEVNASAFGRPEEARLVDALRVAAQPLVSLVAPSASFRPRASAWAVNTMCRGTRSWPWSFGPVPCAARPERSDTTGNSGSDPNSQPGYYHGET